MAWVPVKRTWRLNERHYGALQGVDEQQNAEKDGADWQDVAKLVLHIDPAAEPIRARRAWETHLARARWLTENGYRHLLRGGSPH